MIALIIFIIVLGILVLIHEFGHFFIAKKSGILVEEFGFGFPPALFKKKIGETVYSINAIPLGGFVRLFGEEYHEQDHAIRSNRAFASKKPLIKTMVILGGVMMNLLLGIGIYYGLLVSNNFQSDPLPLINDYQFSFGKQLGKVVASGIVPGSPAQKANLQSGDLISEVSTNEGILWTPITSAESLITIISEQAEQPILIRTISTQNGEEQVRSILPRYSSDLKRNVIGVQLLDAVVLSYDRSIGEKIFSGPLHSYNILAYNMSTIAHLVTYSFKSKSVAPVSQTVSGPIGIYRVVNELVSTSGKKMVTNLLNLIGLLSLSLAFMNVLPFPALDGGRLVFIVYEWIAKKPANQSIEKYVNIIGFVTLLALGILVSINDLLKLIGL